MSVSSLQPSYNLGLGVNVHRSQFVFAIHIDMSEIDKYA